MHFQLSELSEDKFAESTEVEVDNMDEQEELDYMTEEMVNRLVIANKIFRSIFGWGGGEVTVSSTPQFKFVYNIFLF